jgi:hypothetical protein
MSPVLSTAAGATVTYYLSSTCPWSLHASLLLSRNMTFWSDLLSTLAQFTLLSSSTVAAATAASSAIAATATYNYNFLQSTAGYAAAAASYQSFKSHRDPHNNNNNNSNNINNINNKNNSNARNGSDETIHNNVKMLNLTSNLSAMSSLNETLSIGSTTKAATADSVMNNLVDCNDFTEQKLLNIVICSISDVNSNIINGSNAENSTFNDTLRNISDDLIRFYNNNSFYNGTEVSGTSTTGNKTTDFDATIYFIQVITTAVVLGIIILATVIGEFLFYFLNLSLNFFPIIFKHFSPL